MLGKKTLKWTFWQENDVKILHEFTGLFGIIQAKRFIPLILAKSSM